MVIHLHPSREELRNLEAEILQNHIKKMLDDTDQFIIMGDFNCEVHEQIHTDLKKLNFSNVMEEVGGGVQWPMDTIGVTPHKIDHIYMSQPLTSNLFTHKWSVMKDFDMTDRKSTDYGYTRIICQ